MRRICLLVVALAALLEKTASGGGGGSGSSEPSGPNETLEPSLQTRQVHDLVRLISKLRYDLRRLEPKRARCETLASQIGDPQQQQHRFDWLLLAHGQQAGAAGDQKLVWLLAAHRVLAGRLGQATIGNNQLKMLVDFLDECIVQLRQNEGAAAVAAGEEAPPPSPPTPTQVGAETRPELQTEPEIRAEHGEANSEPLVTTPPPGKFIDVDVSRPTMTQPQPQPQPEQQQLAQSEAELEALIGEKTAPMSQEIERLNESLYEQRAENDRLRELVGELEDRVQNLLNTINANRAEMGNLRQQLGSDRCATSRQLGECYRQLDLNRNKTSRLEAELKLQVANLRGQHESCLAELRQLRRVCDIYPGLEQHFYYN